MRHRRRFTSLLLCLCLLLTACGGAETRAAYAGDAADVPAAEPSPSPVPGRQPPAPPKESPALKGDRWIDLSHVSEGIVTVAAESSHRLKVQVLKDEEIYTYDLDPDGSPSVLPLQCGDGSYTFRLLENISGSKYAQLQVSECDAVLIDEFQPFLRPNIYVDYSEDSLCVEKAAELASGHGKPLETVRAVYDYVCDTVSYDHEKVLSVQPGYLPDPDETMQSGKGICFDYASLAAAMLRSQGIPTKVIFGFVAPDDLYHAWNMFYTEESGWVTVSFEVTGDTWTRMDLTFSAGGASSRFVGNGSNYTDLYTY